MRLNSDENPVKRNCGLSTKTFKVADSLVPEASGSNAVPLLRRMLVEAVPCLISRRRESRLGLLGLFRMVLRE
jgi:hypothetical protein